MDGKLFLDLKSNDGNAFALMGHANRLATRMGLEDEEKSKIISEMQNGDYDNLIEVFTKYFGAHVELLGR
jgi:hypothetical protein|tara:strand:+ start:257 stop:466 length:210 start_codon:yes stop_codon:yes gene_type:complete